MVFETSLWVHLCSSLIFTSVALTVLFHIPSISNFQKNFLFIQLFENMFFL